MVEAARIRAQHEAVLERATQDTTTPEDPAEASPLRFILFAAAAVVAVMGTAVLAYVLLAPDGAGSSSTRPGAGFVLLDQFHATIVVSPAAVGDNSVDITVGSHDGTTPKDASVVLTPFEPGSDRPVGDFPAEPVPGTPGAFSVAGLSLPTAGEWSFTVVLHSPDAEPETGTTKIAIEASAGAG